MQDMSLAAVLAGQTSGGVAAHRGRPTGEAALRSVTTAPAGVGLFLPRHVPRAKKARSTVAGRIQ